MPLITLDIPPGVARNGTRYQSQGRWWDANLVRWIEGSAHPVGGWTRVTTSAFANKARALLGWRSNSGQRYLAVGTAAQLWATGDTASFSNITPVGITAGSDDAVERIGYGGGNYGANKYGTVRPSSGNFVPPATWSLDNWGQNLVGCLSSDGKLYEWALNLSTPAAAISGAPTSCSGLIVSEQRHLIALGAGGNPRKVQWSGKEDNTTWTPAAVNEAGSFELQTAGSIRRALRVRGQILCLTDVDAHVMQYIGQPFIFSRDRVGTDCGLIGPNAAVSFQGGAAWMSQKKFWAYDGATVRPLPCEVGDFVFSGLNSVQAYKVTAAHNGDFGEVWWFYPSAGSTENDRYVIWNYRENHWSIGSLARTAWIDSGVWPTPFAMGADNHLYRHEEGWLNNGATRVGSIYLDSAAVEIGDGDYNMAVRQIIPDEDQRGEVKIDITVQQTPGGTSYTYGPYVVRADGYTDARFTGRQAFMRLETATDDDFKVGRFRLDAVQAGRR